MGKVIGIDLGTTNSLVAWMGKGTPEIVPDEEGTGLLPSCVGFQPETGRPVVGFAPRRGATPAAQTYFSIKRFMGRALTDFDPAEIARLPYLIEGDDRSVRFPVPGRSYTPVDLSAMILATLKRRAERYLGELIINEAVITVPAYFNDAQRQATKDAGERAGLDVLRILNEPTAAALAYGLDKRKEGTIAVYDLGGGTFDISILRLEEGVFQVLATAGDNHLGGDNIDDRLTAIVLAEIRDGYGLDLSSDRDFLVRARRVAEEAKKDLSFAETARLLLDLPDGRRFDRVLERDQFDGIVAPLVDRTLGPCRQALKDAGLTAASIDEVVLVGGSTRIPLVKRTVEQLFGRRPHDELNPDEVVALGAAVQADILAGGTTDMLLLDVTPLSLGLETMGGVMERIIERNSTIPCQAKQVFTTAVDNQTGIDIHVLQGERELVSDNRSLARFQLGGLPPMPAGMPKVEITFLLDADGILNVSARELRSGRSASVTVKPTYLSDEEIEGILDDSFDHAEEDIRRRQLIEARVEADRRFPKAEELLTEMADAGDPASLEATRTALATLRTVYESDDHLAIRSAIDALEAAAEPLVAERMNSAARTALRNRSTDEILERVEQARQT
jgi:Fe-S protein assembly chaperone HscA